MPNGTENWSRISRIHLRLKNEQASLKSRKIASNPARRPQASANVRAEIAAHDPDFADVGVGSCNRGIQCRRERNHIGNAMARGDKLAVRALRHFVPPHVAIE